MPNAGKDTRPMEVRNTDQTDLGALIQVLRPIAERLSVAMSTREREQKWETGWTWAKRSLLIFAVVAGLGFWLSLYGSFFGLVSPPAPNTVAVVHIEGPIHQAGLSSADRLVPILRRACTDPNHQGVVLRINSPGGSPTHAERIAYALKACRDRDVPRKVVAVIEGMGASAGYMIAIEADHIVANSYAMVGSIGAVMSKLDMEEGLARLGVHQTVYASGRHKAMFSPYREDDPDQAEVAQALADQVGRAFREHVEARRGNRLRTDVDLYTGRVWLAPEAQALGLVDEVGVLEDAIARHFPGLRADYIRPRRTFRELTTVEALTGALTDQVISRLGGTEIR